MRKEKVAHPRRKRILQALAGLLTLSLVGGGLYTYSTYRALEDNIETVPFLEEDPAAPRPVVLPEFEGALNILVMGSDTRGGGNGAGIGGETPGLSDTTMLLHVAKDRSYAYGVSLPRDSMVERPSCPEKDGSGTDPGGLTQFNQAYAVGGPACTVKTVEALTGVRVNHFVVVDFNGFKAMVDAVGGVRMCVPTAVDDPIGNISLDAGTYTMDGTTALDYVRLRHGLGVDLGDLGRMKRQQAFITALISKATSTDTLTNPAKTVDLLQAGTDALTTDPAFADLAKLGSLAQDLQAIGPENVNFVTVPLELWPQDPNRVAWTSDAELLWERIKTDQPLTKDFLKDAIGGEATKKPAPAAEKKKARSVGSAIDKTTYGLCA